MTDNRNISENVKRRLYAESMGRCMNPDCQIELFDNDGDIIEKAHIDPYSESKDNSFENLVILCPNCHTKFDKNALFTRGVVRNWKETRQEQIKKIFEKKYSSFSDLSKEVVPLLIKNKIMYENYYLNDRKELWDKFEFKIIVNNKKLKMLFQNNLELFQKNRNQEYSNLTCIFSFISHVDEFENTRLDNEKIRKILFPEKINSMFGIAPVKDYLLPLTESLEVLITKLYKEGKRVVVNIGNENPYIQIIENGQLRKIILNDTPRLRQLYFDYDCFKNAGVRFGDLNFALQYITNQKLKYQFIEYNNLRKITVEGHRIIFIYKYCLSKVELTQLSPEPNSCIVNLHNWNGSSCISKEAYELAKEMNITLLTKEEFYAYIRKIKNNIQCD